MFGDGVCTESIEGEPRADLLLQLYMDSRYLKLETVQIKIWWEFQLRNLITCM